MTRLTNSTTSAAIMDRARVRMAGGNGMVSVKEFAARINAVLPNGCTLPLSTYFAIRNTKPQRTLSAPLLWLVYYRAGEFMAVDDFVVKDWAADMLKDAKLMQAVDDDVHSGERIGGAVVPC